MTGLLVSVRDLAEAKLALAGGADLIDLKEPKRGSLGRCRVDVWQQVCQYVGDRCLVSAALGELAYDPVTEAASETIPFDFLKIGLAGCRSVGDWESRWAHALQTLPRESRKVAVLYADSAHANSPAVCEILSAAPRVGCRAILFDTYGKQGGTLFDYLPLATLGQLLQQAHARRLVTVLGGSLDLSTLDAAVSLGPSYVAVRGGVCRGNRESKLDGALVQALADRLSDLARSGCRIADRR